jgi:hypothetical protein
MLDFPSNPSFGDKYTTPSGIKYEWDSIRWILSSDIEPGSGGGGSALIISDTPLNANEYDDGTQWFDPSSDATVIKYTDANNDQVWIQSSSCAGGSALGGLRSVITDDLSVNGTVTHYDGYSAAAVLDFNKYKNPTISEDETYTVGSTGSDFTTLEEAFAYIQTRPTAIGSTDAQWTGKRSPQFKLDLAAETFTVVGTNDTLRLNAMTAHVLIYGAGVGSTIIEGTSGSDYGISLLFSNCATVKIDNLTIDGTDLQLDARNSQLRIGSFVRFTQGSVLSHSESNVNVAVTDDSIFREMRADENSFISAWNGSFIALTFENTEGWPSCLASYNKSSVHVFGGANFTASFAHSGRGLLYCEDGGSIYLPGNVTFSGTVTDGTALNVTTGGQIHIAGTLDAGGDTIVPINVLQKDGSAIWVAGDNTPQTFEDGTTLPNNNDPSALYQQNFIKIEGSSYAPATPAVEENNEVWTARIGKVAFNGGAGMAQGEIEYLNSDGTADLGGPGSATGAKADAHLGSHFLSTAGYDTQLLYGMEDVILIITIGGNDYKFDIDNAFDFYSLGDSFYALIQHIENESLPAVSLSDGLTPNVIFESAPPTEERIVVDPTNPVDGRHYVRQDSDWVEIPTKNWISCGDGEEFEFPPTSTGGAKAIAMGYVAKADGYGSIAIGQSTATGQNSIVIGSLDEADSIYGIAMGNQAIARGISDIAIGTDAETDKDSQGYSNSIAIGESSNSYVNQGIAVGYGAQARDDTQICISNNGPINSPNGVGISIALLADGAGGLRVKTDGSLETSDDGGTTWTGVGASTLDELDDVDLSGSPAPAAGQVLTYDDTQSPPQWISADAGGGNNWISANDGADFTTAPNATTARSVAIGEGANIGKYENQIFIRSPQSDGTRNIDASNTIVIGDITADLEEDVGWDVDNIIIGGCDNVGGGGMYRNVVIGSKISFDRSSGGADSVIIGNESQLIETDNAATMVGYSTICNDSIGSIVIGTYAKAEHTESVTIVGKNSSITNTTGDPSSAAGSSVAVGSGADITDSPFSTAIGSGATISANSDFSTVIGTSAEAKADSPNAIVIGFAADIDATSPYAIRIGCEQSNFIRGNSTTNKILVITDDAGLRIQNTGTLETTADGGSSWGEIPNSTILLARDYVDDTAAGTGGVPVGGLYHNAGVVRIRIA